MRATNRLHARFGQPEVFDLAFANQVLHRARDVLDRNVRVDAVLIEQIDPIGLESLQRRVGDLPDVRGPAVQTRLLAALELEAELRRNHHLIANRAERFPDELFVRERPVGFGGVEERDATVNGRADDRDAFFPARGRPVAEADAHAAEAERRHFQAALSQVCASACVERLLSRSHRAWYCSSLTCSIQSTALPFNFS